MYANSASGPKRFVDDGRGSWQYSSRVGMASFLTLSIDASTCSLVPVSEIIKSMSRSLHKCKISRAARDGLHKIK